MYICLCEAEFLPAFLIPLKLRKSQEDVGKAPAPLRGGGGGGPGDARKREEKERYDKERVSGAVPHLRIWCLNVPAQPHLDVEKRVGFRTPERSGGGRAEPALRPKKWGGKGGRGLGRAGRAAGGGPGKWF